MRGKPRYLGLVLTVVLLLAMAVVGALVASSQQGLAGLFSLSLTEVASAPPAAATPSPAITRAEPAATLAPPAPELTEAATQAVAAAMAALTLAPEATDEAGANEPEVATAAEAPRIEETPGEAVSPEEADRVYAATGVWLRAPRLPLLPQTGEAVSISAALPTLSPGKELEAPPVLVAIAPDAGPRAQVASSVPDGVRGPDDQGLAQVLTDSPGVQVVAGAPFLIPPARSASPASEADDWLNTMAEPPSRFPPERPDAPYGFAAGAESAASEDPAPAEAAAPWLNAMAEPPSRFPPARPEPPAEFLAAQVAAPAAGPAVADGAAAAPGGVSLGALRPAPRPDNLSPPEGYEPPPRTLASFDGPRPDSRPDDLAPEAPEPPDVSDALVEALTAPEPAPAAPNLQSTLAAIVQDAPDPLAGATRQAVAVARVPDTRPRNFDRVVQRQLDRIARASQQAAAPRSSGGAGGVGTRGPTAQEEAEAAGEAEVASSAAALPSGPTATSVAAAATSADSIALREINLIGVYGQPNARRALVRLGNGRYLRVGVGDQLDGGQVTAIGDYVLNYTKRGRTQQLVIPGG